MTQKLVFGRAENIEETGENADYLHFLLFSQPFSKAFFLRVIKKAWDVL